MSTIKTCPLCGGAGEIKKNVIHLKGLDGGKFDAPQFSFHCKKCNEEVLDEELTETEQKISKQAYHKEKLVHIVDSISTKFKSISFVERSLGLPLRSVNRWKFEGTSTSSFLVAKFIDSMPFLVEIANNDFDEDKKDLILLKESFSAFKRLANKKYFVSTFEAQSKSNGCRIIYSATSIDQTHTVDSASGGVVNANVVKFAY